MAGLVSYALWEFAFWTISVPAGLSQGTTASVVKKNQVFLGTPPPFAGFPKDPFSRRVFGFTIEALALGLSQESLSHDQPLKVK